MKITLINPPPHRQIEEYDIPTWQHLGMGRLSSYVKQFNHKVRLIDSKLQRLTIEKTLELVDEDKPDIVGITAMTTDIYNAYAVARGVKKIDKSIITIIGGCHATVMPETTLREESCIDYLVFGEGERAFKEFLDVIASGASKKQLSQIMGLVFRNGSEIIKNEKRPWDTHIEEFPMPDWQLHHYATQYKLETSRGCPFQCNFCMRVLGNTVRNFPEKNIFEELKNIMRVREHTIVEIVDETFTLNHARISRLLDGMIELDVGKKIQWYCSTRVNTLSADILKKMKKAGCFSVGFGVESGNQEILNSMKKQIKSDDVINAVRLCREAGIKSFLGFILGHPNEKLEQMVDSINLSARANPDSSAFGTMVPYPGTEIAAIVERGEGNYKLLSKDWTEYNRQFSFVLELKDVSKKDMDKLQLAGTLKLFIYNRRVVDLIRFLYKYRLESIQFFIMLFSKKKVDKNRSSPSRISFMQLVHIFFSDPRKPYCSLQSSRIPS